MAQYFEDWSDSTIGSAPTGWTARWAVTSGIWSIIDGGGGTKLLRYGNGSTTATRNALSFNAVDADADRDDVEIVFKWRCNAVNTNGPQLKGWLRASGTSTSSTHNAYLGGVDYASSSSIPLRLQKYVSGTSSTIGTSTAFTPTANTWYITRLRINGTTLQSKSWLASGSEPGPWDRTETDSSISAAGWVGLFSFSGLQLHDVEFVGVGTNGDSAPLSEPSADTAAPTLTGDITITALASTSYTATWPAGSDDTAVTGYEYRIAGGSWVDAGNVLTVNISGRTPSTTEDFEVRAYDAAGNRSTPALIESVTLEAGAVSIAVQHDLDSGNINPSLTVITDSAGSEPAISVKPRATPSTLGSSHVHWFFALTGAEGKRPTITVDNSVRWVSTTMGSGWRPVYSYDLQTWHQASAFTPLTSPARVRFQFPAAFTADTVYIADHPVFQYAHAAALAAELLADASGLVHVSAEADAFGVIGTTPTENDDIGRAVGGNSMWGFRLEDESATTTDGGPRRELVVTHGIHAGEVIDGWYLRGLIDWYLNDASAEAVAFRRNWRVLVYFMLTPNGRKGGGWRGNFRSEEDPNRDWADPSAWSLYETATVRDAILADTSRHDVHLDLHAAVGATTIEQIYYRTDLPIERYNAFKAAFDAADSGTMLLTASTASQTIGEWAKVVGGAQLVVISEAGTQNSATIARYEEIAGHYLHSIAVMDAAGEFWVPSETAPGAVAALSLSAPAGTAAASTSASGTPQTLSLSAPAGDATTASTTFASGDLAALSLAAPNGTSTARAAVSAGIQALSLTAPAGDASSASTTFASGDVAPVSLAAPAGTTAQSTASSGAVQSVSLTAANGNAMTGAEMVAAGDIAPIGISAADGATLAAANAAGAIRYLTIGALTGTANDGSAPDFDLRGSVFARVPAHYDVFARLQ